MNPGLTTALWLSAGVVAVTLAVWLHVVFWGWVYRLRSDSDGELTAVAADGWPLRVSHFIPRDARGGPPVVLCHGLSANRWNLMLPGRHSLAAVLREAGHEVFVVDLRGSGDSDRPPPGRTSAEVDFDAHALLDAPAVLQLALDVSRQPKAFWVGHSMGGLVGLALAQSAHGAQLAGVVALGSPTQFNFHHKVLVTLLGWSLRAGVGGRIRHRWLVRLAAPYLFTPVPGGLVYHRPNMDSKLNRAVAYHVLGDPSVRILRQFHGWLSQDAWALGSPRTDLREGLARVTCPVLFVAGSLDLLSPPENMAAGLARLGSADRTLVVVGRARGDSQDYGHGDLIFGKQAPEEVFPQVERWLRSHAPVTTAT
jgi:pimeloyl-ACP methyl ester carboxylesterase